MTRPKLYESAGRRLTESFAAAGYSRHNSAVRLKINESTLRGYLAGFSAPLDSDPVWSRLAELVGAEATTSYRAAVALVRSGPVPALSSEGTFDWLVRRGRLGEAIENLTRTSSDLEPLATAARWEQVARIQAYGGSDDAMKSYERAVSALRPVAQDHPAKYFDLIDGIASFLIQQEQYDKAAQVVEAELTRDVDVARLWRRLGHINWYADRNVAAYACLNTALGLGFSRRAILHARGQVLTELGLFRAAAADLREVLESEVLSESAMSFARAGLAMALHGLGRQSDAWFEFNKCLQVTPENAWLHWRMAVCSATEGDIDKAHRSFSYSLKASAPRLTAGKRRHAQEAVGTTLL